MKLKPTGPQKDQSNIELILQDIGNKIEDLKLKFNLFFAGELRVPPDKEREDLEKRIRNMMHSGHKSPRINLLLQNISSRFSLYNNMWLKRLNELETGVSVLQRKRLAYTEEKKPSKPKGLNVEVSLNSEDSFEKFFDKYANLTGKTFENPEKEKVINSLKFKLISANLVDAKVSLGVEDGKLKIKVKGVQ